MELEDEGCTMLGSAREQEGALCFMVFQEESVHDAKRRPWIRMLIMLSSVPRESVYNVRQHFLRRLCTILGSV